MRDIPQIIDEFQIQPQKLKVVEGNANIFPEPQAKTTHRNEDNKMANFIFGPMLHLSQKTSMHDCGAWFWKNIEQMIHNTFLFVT